MQVPPDAAEQHPPLHATPVEQDVVHRPLARSQAIPIAQSPGPMQAGAASLASDVASLPFEVSVAASLAPTSAGIIPSDGLVSG